MKNSSSLRIAKLFTTTPARDGLKPDVKQNAASVAAIAPLNDFMSVKEAAFYLKVSKSFLDKLRVNGGGPEFVRLSARKILYRRSDLDSWARQRRFESTAQYPGLK